MKIPWKSLYTSPTVICVEDIFILVEPNLQVKYDADKEEKLKYESKKKEIEKVEAAKKAEAEKGNISNIKTMSLFIIKIFFRLTKSRCNIC